jgi:hypothetical protein
VFGIVGAHSPALPTYAGIENALIPEQDYPKDDPIEIARRLNPKGAPRVWLDVGNADDWRAGVRLLDSVLTARSIEHWFSPVEGGHVQEYWISRLPEYLSFYSGMFQTSADY